VRATYPEQEPNDTCGQAQQMACGDVVNPAYLDVNDLDWYSWNMNAGDQVTCGTDAVYGGDNTDTYIELFAGDCTTLLAQDDDGGPGFYSLISNFAAPYTGTYFLKVRGYTCLNTGPYKFYINCIAPPPAGNDLCSGAIEIPRGSSGSLNGDTSNAQNDYDPGPGGCTGYSAAGLDVVYFVNALAGDVLDLTYLQQNTDTSFYIVTDCSNVAGSCVAGADQTVPPDPEVIHYVATTSGIYYIILDSYSHESGGPWTLDYSFSIAAPQACCFPDGRCEMHLPDECRRVGGTPQGEGTTCDWVYCMMNPTKPTTWGHIKAVFR
jgi:hypothetical protein